MLKYSFLLISALFLAACSSTQPSYKYVNTAKPSSKTPGRVNNTPAPRPTRSSSKKPILKPNYPVYEVRKGDTLSSISRRSGLTVAQIQRYNNLKSTRLEIDQRLYLPGVYKLSKAKVNPPPMSYPVSKNISVIPRSRWAKYKVKGNVTPMGKVTKITIHHTDDGPKLSKMSDVKFLQGMESHHRNNRKWACIGYHYIIGRDGTIYEGRPAAYQGAHARSNNQNNIGISLIGDFNKAYPAKSQLTSLTALLSNLRSKHKISAKSVVGHRHLNQTECPGKYLASWINSYRASR
ncbi:MAG: N-acetylmuramoyl-L-alanine amidase [Lentisphaerales bacterium]|nr:N-acetylmuramoyl-L-alanine amidase [Lentisphaerales bacterium]